MFEKMFFEDEREKEDFDKYRELKGENLFLQVYQILLESMARVPYDKVRAHIRYDKNLRDKLYIYLATLEEYCRAQLLNRYDVSKPKKYAGHCYKELLQDLIKKENTHSVLYYGFQPDFGDLMHICNGKGVCHIDDDAQKHIKKLRNDTMHHSLLLFGNAKTVYELKEHFTVLEKQLNAFCLALPETYQNGFRSDLDKLNLNEKHQTQHIDQYYLEIINGRICIKK